MKEEWKVFIKGVPNRGEEVIKALIDLGAKSSFCQTGTFSSLIYYIKHDGIIDSVNIEGEFANIIKDNYKEIKLPERWKDGDLLININRTEYTIFKHYSFGNMFYSYIFADEDNVKSYPNQVLCYAKFYRLASDEEHEKFYELLHKHGKDWDSEKKHLVKLKRKPTFDISIG